MLKLVIQIKESKDQRMNIGMKKISEKEFNSSTQLEKILASQIKGAIEAEITKIVNENKKEGN